MYPSGSSPFDSSSCQNTDSFGTEPSIMGDLLYQCLSSATTDFFFFLNLSTSYFHITPQHLWNSFSCTVYNSYTSEVKLEVYHCIPQIHCSQTADVWTSQGSHRTLSRWRNHTVSALSPRQPETLTMVKWNTRHSRHLQTLFILLFADGLLLLKENMKTY